MSLFLLFFYAAVFFCNFDCFYFNLFVSYITILKVMQFIGLELFFVRFILFGISEICFV